MCWFHVDIMFVSRNELYIPVHCDDLISVDSDYMVRKFQVIFILCITITAPAAYTVCD